MPVFTDLSPKQQSMSLGDILNVARGAQAYQQTQQLNPLQLQKAQMEIEQLQKINPLAARKAEAETKSAELGFTQAEKKAPLEFQQTEQATEKSRLELAGQNLKQFQNVMGGFATDKRMLDAVARNDVKAAQKLLGEGVGQLLTSGFNSPSFLQGAAEMMDYAQKDLKNLPAKLNTLNLQAVSPETRVTAQTGGVVEINGVKYQFNPTTKALTPIGEEVAPAAAPMAPAAPAAPAIAPQRGGLVPLDMPVSGKVPQLNTQQQERYKFGEALMRDSAQLAQAAGDSRQTIRQIKQNISQAAGSKPEQLVRNAGRWIGGNEELDELLKSLADNQMRQAQMMGVGTDAARSTVATASGSADISAGALNMIANRADAMNTAFEKFNKGLSAFQQKHGKVNGSIHADNFKQAWSQNYDPLVFLVQNINASDLTPAEKQMELQKLLKGTSEQQRKELARKAENIKRLEKGDF